MTKNLESELNRDAYDGKYRNLTWDQINSLYQQHSGTNNFNRNAFDSYLQWYDQYLEKIKPYKQSPYYQRLLNNPYANYQTYQPGSIGEDISFALGIRGGEQSFYNSRMTSADEELGKILTEMQANNYNSPAMQASRDRAAGINDSLTGQTNGGEPFAAQGPDENNPLTGSQVTPESLGDLAGIAALPMNFMKGIVSIIGAFQDVNLKDIDIGQQEVALDKEVRGNEVETVVSGMPAVDPKDASFVDVVGDALENAANGPKYRSRAARRAQKQARGSVFYDEAGKPSVAIRQAYNERMKGLSGDSKEIAENMSYPGYSSSDLLGFSSQLAERVTNIQIESAKVAKELADIRLRLEKHGILSEEKKQDAEFASAANQEAYEKEFAAQNGAEIQAQADVEGFAADKVENEVRKSKAQFDKMIQQSKTDIARIVHGFGGRLGRAAVILLPGIFATIDSFSDRFMNHFDSALDIVLNPLGKTLGAGLAKAIQ